MTGKLRVPCTYQGGKQRVAKEIVDQLLDAAATEKTVFFDLCCGSGAISVELVNRGIDPRRIVMLDGSSWGVFWAAIGNGKFNIDVFDELLRGLPQDKRDLKGHIASIASQPIGKYEAEIYPLLQACSFGGKQIWRQDDRWQNAFFRDYWEPTETSVRRSPANPMQPNALELKRRVEALRMKMLNVGVIHSDIYSVLETSIPEDAVVYVDPPYRGTTGYGFGFDLHVFINKFLAFSNAPLFISEGIPLVNDAMKLSFGGAKGGISGNRAVKHEEWLSRYQSNPIRRA